MKHIKLLLLSLLTFFVLFTLIGLLFPSSVHTVKAVVIEKKPVEVLSALKAQRSWINWYPFFSQPQGAAIKEENNSAAVFTNQGKQLHITNIKSDSTGISFSVQSWSGTQTEATILALPVTGTEQQTQLMWRESEHLKWYPWDRFRGLLLEGTKGIFVDTALARFKRFIETPSPNQGN